MNLNKADRKVCSFGGWWLISFLSYFSDILTLPFIVLKWTFTSYTWKSHIRQHMLFQEGVPVKSFGGSSISFLQQIQAINCSQYHGFFCMQINLFHTCDVVKAGSLPYLWFLPSVTRQLLEGRRKKWLFPENSSQTSWQLWKNQPCCCWHPLFFIFFETFPVLGKLIN